MCGLMTENGASTVLEIDSTEVAVPVANAGLVQVAIHHSILLQQYANALVSLEALSVTEDVFSWHIERIRGAMQEIMHSKHIQNAPEGRVMPGHDLYDVMASWQHTIFSDWNRALGVHQKEFYPSQIQMLQSTLFPHE